jgi:hypothetical protein
MPSPLLPARPIFVVGMQRSGTTLMRSLLCSHSNIAIVPGESQYLVREGREPESRLRDDFDAFFDQYAGSAFFQRLGIDADETRALIKTVDPITHAVVFGTVIEQYARHVGKARAGDKSPMHEAYVDTLLSWFPDARIVYMIRDPRSVIASLRNVRWQKRLRSNVDGFAERWRLSATRAMKAASDDRRCVVRYESLVATPKPEVRRICKFLDEPYEPEIIRARGASKGGERRVTAKSLDKWRDALSRGQIATIEHMTRREMVHFGYEPDTAALPWHVAPTLLATRGLRYSARAAKRFAGQLSKNSDQRVPRNASASSS